MDYLRSLAFFGVFVSLVFCAPSYCIASDLEMSAPRFIAHAGGAVDRQTYTNSLEALNSNYDKGFRFFEMDFSWTSDRELVSIHDWEDSFQERFYVPADMDVPTKAQFLHLKTKTGLTQLSLEDVFNWAEEKGDVFIVTDIKEENIKALRKICTDFRKYKKFIIPQAYSYQGYDEIVKLGYRDIILTLYRMSTTFEELIQFSKERSPFAITMQWRAAQTGIVKYLNRTNTRVYAHTVNDMNLFSSLRKSGVFGIYTDSISPP